MNKPLKHERVAIWQHEPGMGEQIGSILDYIIKPDPELILEGIEHELDGKNMPALETIQDWLNSQRGKTKKREETDDLWLWSSEECELCGHDPEYELYLHYYLIHAYEGEIDA